MSASGPPFAIDAERCAGHGRCYALAPGVFEPDEMGYARLKPEIDPAEIPDDRETIVFECPEGAISAP